MPSARILPAIRRCLPSVTGRLATGRQRDESDERDGRACGHIRDVLEHGGHVDRQHHVGVEHQLADAGSRRPPRHKHRPASERSREHSHVADPRGGPDERRCDAR